MGIVNDLIRQRERLDLAQIELNADVAEYEADTTQSRFIGGKSLKYRQTIIDRQRSDVQRKLQALANRGEPWRLRLRQKQDEVATLEVEVGELQELKQAAYESLVSKSGSLNVKANEFKTYSDMLSKKRKLLQYAQNSLFQHRVRKPIGVYETLPEELMQMAARDTPSEQNNMPAVMSDLEQLAREFMHDPQKMREYAKNDLNTDISAIYEVPVVKSDNRMPDIGFGFTDIEETKEETNEPTDESTDANSD